MKSPKVKTQKNLSALIAIALAAVTIFTAGTANSTSPTATKAKLVESEIIAEIEQMIFEDEATFEDKVIFEEAESNVKVFDENNELLGAGTTAGNKNLRALVNQAELVSELGSTKYYKIVK
jgi:hypothetical protein